jgi:hypothetical protein
MLIGAIREHALDRSGRGPGLPIAGPAGKELVMVLGKK